MWTCLTKHVVVEVSLLCMKQQTNIVLYMSFPSVLATLLRFHSTSNNTNSALLRATISHTVQCIYMTCARQTGITSHSTRQYTCKAMRAPAEYKSAFWAHWHPTDCCSVCRAKHNEWEPVRMILVAKSAFVLVRRVDWSRMAPSVYMAVVGLCNTCHSNT